MNRLVAAGFALLLCAAPAAAQDPEQLQEMMQEAYQLMVKGAEQVKDPATKEQGVATYDQACELYEQILDGIQDAGLPQEAIDELTQVSHYNIACARSLQGRTEQALAALKAAIDAGWADHQHMENDPDLAPIRKTEGYKQLLGRLQAGQKEKAAAEAKRTLAEGESFAYDFDVTTLDGKKLKLADLRGKVVIVDYWGTWCPPCKKEVPHFVELQKRFGDKLQIVGMTYEHGAGGAPTIEKVKAFAKQHGINYPLTLVTDQAELRKVPGFRAFPTTLFIDKSGKVRAMEVGYRDEQFLTAMVEALDAEEGGPAPAPAPAPAKPKTGDDSEWF